jgi:hypothetical protein
MRTDLEISKALALAIGWRYVYTTDAMCLVYTFDARNKAKVRGVWLVGCRVFDYRDWNVIGPIAERFDLFPMNAICHADQWAIVTESIEVYTDTPQKAVALAVIQGAKK